MSLQYTNLEFRKAIQPAQYETEEIKLIAKIPEGQDVDSAMQEIKDKAYSCFGLGSAAPAKKATPAKKAAPAKKDAPVEE